MSQQNKITPEGFYLKKGNNMSYCEFLKGCLLFGENFPKDSALGSLFEKSYCQNNSSFCARHKVSKELGIEYVPCDLYPMMGGMAIEIIKKAKLEAKIK